MTLQEAYEKATLQNLSDPKGTRQDIIYLAMKIYAREAAELAFEAGESYGMNSQIGRPDEMNKTNYLNSLYGTK